MTAEQKKELDRMVEIARSLANRGDLWWQGAEAGLTTALKVLEGRSNG